MTERLDDTLGWVTPVDGPANGEFVTGDSVNDPLSAAISRARYLYDIVGPGGTGTKRLNTVAGVADVRAMTGQVDGDWIFSLATGAYSFSAASTAVDDGVFILQPTVGSGRWIHLLNGIAGGIGGLATLSGTGRVIQRSSGALVLETWVEDTFLGTDVDTATWTDVTGSDLTFTAGPGDRLMCDAVAFIQATGGGSAVARIHITHTSGTYTSTAGLSSAVGTTQTKVTLKSGVASLPAGTVTVKLQLQNATATDHARMTTFLLNIRQSRP